MDDFDLYARFYDLDYGERDQDLDLYRLYAQQCGSPILELACGTGRVLLPLARQGYRITGVDVSPAMLDVARRKAAAEGLGERVTLVKQDMRELDLAGRFNLAFVAANSFSHLSTLDEQLTALAHIRQHLNPGGLLLLDLFNPDPERLLESDGRVVLEKVLTDPDTGHRLLKQFSRWVDFGKQLLSITFIMDDVDGEGSVTRTLFPFTMRYFYRFELELLLRHAGFEVEAIYGSWDLEEFSGDSEKLIAVARRPG